MGESLSPSVYLVWWPRFILPTYAQFVCLKIWCVYVCELNLFRLNQIEVYTTFVKPLVYIVLFLTKKKKAFNMQYIRNYVMHC